MRLKSHVIHKENIHGEHQDSNGSAADVQLKIHWQTALNLHFSRQHGQLNYMRWHHGSYNL
jgi:hypothetical protein